MEEGVALAPAAAGVAGMALPVASKAEFVMARTTLPRSYISKGWPGSSVVPRSVRLPGIDTSTMARLPDADMA